jgi:hypothetical protein
VSLHDNPTGHDTSLSLSMDHYTTQTSMSIFNKKALIKIVGELEMTTQHQHIHYLHFTSLHCLTFPTWLTMDQ